MTAQPRKQPTDRPPSTSPPPADVVVLDLDANRAARRARNGPGPKVLLGGITYELPPRPPFGILTALGDLQAGDLTGVRRMLEAMFGPEAMTNPTIGELDEDDLADLLGRCYGLDLGNAGASPAP